MPQNRRDAHAFLCPQAPPPQRCCPKHLFCKMCLQISNSGRWLNGRSILGYPCTCQHSHFSALGSAADLLKSLVTCIQPCAAATSISSLFCSHRTKRHQRPQSRMSRMSRMSVRARSAQRAGGRPLGRCPLCRPRNREPAKTTCVPCAPASAAPASPHFYCSSSPFT